MYKVYSIKNSPLISFSVCLIAYFPFLYASQFLYPLGMHEWDWISFFGGSFESMSYLELQQYWHQNAGGRYTSNALLGTLPYWYNLSTFRIVALAFLLLLPLSLFWLIKQLKLKKFTWVLFGSIWILYLDQLTNIYDSLLRFTCMPIYHLGLMGVFIFAGLLYLWKQSNYQHKGMGLLAIILGVFTIGTNEISLLHILMIGGYSLFYFYYDKRKIPWLLVSAMGIISIGIFISLAAPGNFERQGLYPDPSIFKSIALSLTTSVFLWVEWLTNSLILPMSIIWSWAYIRFYPSIESKFFTKPIRWILALITLCPLSLFPLLYGTSGASLPERVVDMLFLCSSILLIGSLFSLINLYQEKFLDWQKNTPKPFLKMLILSISIFIGLNLFFGGLSINRSLENRDKGYLSLITIDANIGLAYLQMFKQIPNTYSKEMNKIADEIQYCKQVNCFVTEITATNFIGYDPIYDRMHSKGERGMSLFFNKPKIEAVFYQKNE